MAWQTLALIGLGSGLLLGLPLARRSHAAKPILTGLGQFFHYLACAAVAGMPIAFIAGLVTHTGRSLFFVALGFLTSAFLLLIFYAIPERSAQDSESQ